MTTATKTYQIDCRFFNGEKPCVFKKECLGCEEYKPLTLRILIVKLGAMGDVLRTTSILPPLRKRYPDAQISWLVDKVSVPLLQHNKEIDRLIVWKEENIHGLLVEEFDLLISLEKIVRGTAVAERVKAKKKLGFGLSEYGTPYPYNKESEYSFQLGISDRLKFKENKKSYQRIVYDMLSFNDAAEEETPYMLVSDPEQDASMKKKLADCGVDFNKTLIGIAPGSGTVFANKNWNVPKYIALVNHLVADDNLQVVLLGGEGDTFLCNAIKENLEVDKILDSGRDNNLEEYVSLMKHIDLLVSGDTLPMHIALAHGKKVVTLFGPTCHQEIEMFGRGKKILTSLDCAPCYRGHCDIHPNCMDVITVDEVHDAVIDLL